MNAPQVETYVVDTAQGIDDLCEIIAQSGEYAVIDCETNHKSEALAKLYGLGICVRDNEAYYIPFRRQDGSEYEYEHRAKIFFKLLSHLRQKKLVGHNIIYDVLVIERCLGMSLVESIYSDTILQKHALNEEKPFGLKEVAVQYLGPWADKAAEALYANIEKNGGKTTKEQMDMYLADTDVLAEYCCWDVLLTWKLFNLFEPQIHNEGLADLFYRDEIMPLYREVTIPMKRRGFHVDLGHFERLKTDITVDITACEQEFQSALGPLVAERIAARLNADHPVSVKGNFPKVAAELLDVYLPLKEGKVTLAKKGIEDLRARGHLSTAHSFYDWLLGKGEFPGNARLVQERMYQRAKERQYVFNLNSSDDLRWLLFDKLKLKPISKTDSGEPSVDAETLDELSGKHLFCDRIVAYKKLNKLLSTYIEGVLENAINGVIYTSLLMFGTTSGRYSSRNINMQNLPRVKDDESKLDPIVLKYTNAIKAGFVAPEGYVLVNADYAALEPTAFAHMSGDEKLREVFRRGYDLYSAIAIDVWNLREYSADKKAPNYLGKHRKEVRQKAKVFCLAVVYGAEAPRIADALGVEIGEAQKIIDDYLDTYPNLRAYMQDAERQALEYGEVRTVFGRIRHLPNAKRLWDTYGEKLKNARWASINGLREQRSILKNALNNAKNLPIQGIAAHIVNRAMLATNRRLRIAGLDAEIIMTLHDEITLLSSLEHASQAKDILRECMEHTVKLSVPLKAEPIIAKTWAEAK